MLWGDLGSSGGGSVPAEVKSNVPRVCLPGSTLWSTVSREAERCLLGTLRKISTVWFIWSFLSLSASQHDTFLVKKDQETGRWKKSSKKKREKVTYIKKQQQKTSALFILSLWALWAYKRFPLLGPGFFFLLPCPLSCFFFSPVTSTVGTYHPQCPFTAPPKRPENTATPHRLTWTQRATRCCSLKPVTVCIATWRCRKRVQSCSILLLVLQNQHIGGGVLQIGWN